MTSPIADARRPRSAETTDPDGGRLGALGHGLAVFDMFDTNHQTVTVSEISRFLGIHKSTASRIAANLARSGFLVPASSGSGFQLSGKLTRLGAIAAAQTDVASAAAPHVQALAEDTGETCDAGVLVGQQAVAVAVSPGTYSVRMHSWVGRRTDASTSASGRVLLAGLSGSAIDALYQGHALAHIEQSGEGVLELEQRLRTVRQRGFALDNEELEPALRCIAAPIVDHAGAVVAAVAVQGVASRVTLARVDYFVAKTQATAAATSAVLGASEYAPYRATAAEVR